MFGERSKTKDARVGGENPWERADREVIHKFGINLAVGNTFEPVSYESEILTLPQLLANSEALSVSSTSALDDVIIDVQGLDENGDYINEQVTLNGQTPVNLSGLWFRVFRIQNLGIQLNGDLWVYPQGASVTGGEPDNTSDIRASVAAIYNQTTTSAFTVPKGYTAYITRALMTCAKGDEVEVKPAVRMYGNPLYLPYAVYRLYETPITLDINENPISVPELTDMVLLAKEISGAGLPTVSVTYTIVLVKL